MSARRTSEAFAAGAARVLVSSPRDGWRTGTTREPVDRTGHAAALYRAGQPGDERFTAQERTRIGLHTCPGGDSDSVIARRALQRPAAVYVRHQPGYFLIELASERDKDPVDQLRGEPARRRQRRAANGLRGGDQPAEPPGGRAGRGPRRPGPAANFIPKEQLGSPMTACSPRSASTKAQPSVTGLRPRDRLAEDHQPSRGHQASRGQARHQLIGSPGGGGPHLSGAGARRPVKRSRTP